MGQVHTAVGFKPNYKSMSRLNRQDINYLKTHINLKGREETLSLLVLKSIWEEIGPWAGLGVTTLRANWINTVSLKYLGETLINALRR